MSSWANDLKLKFILEIASQDSYRVGVLVMQKWETTI